MAETTQKTMPNKKTWLDDKRRLAKLSLIVAAVFLIAINALAGNLFRGATVDFTQDKTYTLSPNTQKVLAEIAEPITLRFFYSTKLGETVPQYGTLSLRVREMLERYAALSRGRIKLEIANPEPFSDDEDRAASYGLQGVPVDQSGEQVYFGLIGTNAADDEEKIAFFQPSRERFIEQDLTRLVYALGQPKRKVVGLITNLPIFGQFRGIGQIDPPWQVYQRMSELFEMRNVSADAKEIDKDVAVLLIVHPDNLSEQMQYAIDQFVMRGGKVIAMVDQVPEVARSPRPIMGMQPVGPGSDMPKLFEKWGIEIVKDKFAGDRTNAVRVNFGESARAQVVQYVAWLNLREGNLNRKDPVTADVANVLLATASVIKRRADAQTTVTPLITTSPSAMEIDANTVRFQPNPIRLLDAYVAGKEPLVLAARITGKIKTAFPDGPPKAADKKDEKKDETKPDDKKDDKKDDAKKDEKKDEAKKDEPKKDEPKAPAHLTETTGDANIIVIGDVDFLQDQFWAQAQNFFGQTVVTPTAGNAELVMNALDQMTGANVLLGMRGRAITQRPFTKVAQMEELASEKWSKKEKDLQQSLKTAQEKLKDLRGKARDGGKVELTADQKKAMEEFQSELLRIRKELRDVQFNLRKDINTLDANLKAINIGLIPLIVAIVAIVLGFVRRMRRRQRHAHA